MSDCGTEMLEKNDFNRNRNALCNSRRDTEFMKYQDPVSFEVNRENIIKKLVALSNNMKNQIRNKKTQDSIITFFRNALAKNLKLKSDIKTTRFR